MVPPGLPTLSGRMARPSLRAGRPLRRTLGFIGGRVLSTSDHLLPWARSLSLLLDRILHHLLPLVLGHLPPRGLGHLPLRGTGRAGRLRTFCLSVLPIPTWGVFDQRWSRPTHLMMIMDITRPPLLRRFRGILPTCQRCLLL